MSNDVIDVRVVLPQAIKAVPLNYGKYRNDQHYYQ